MRKNMLFLQLANVILGSGLLGLPYVAKLMGLSVALGILVATFLLVGGTGILMLRPLPEVPIPGYHSLTSHLKATLPPDWRMRLCTIVVMIGIFTQELGALVSYTYIVIQDATFLHPAVVGTFAFVFLLWVSTMELTRISGFSVICMLIFLFYKMAFVAMPNKLICATNITNSNSTPVGIITPQTVWWSVSTCFFATVCHTTLGSFACVHGACTTRLHFYLCMALVFILYVATMVCDVFTFPYLTDNILDIFVQCVPGAVAVVSLYKISIMTTVPTLFISVCGQVPNINPIVVKSVALIVAIVMASFAASLGWLLSVFGCIAGAINIFVMPVVLNLVL